MRWTTWTGELGRATGRLRGAPVFTLFSVLSLAAGIGVTTAIFAVVSSLAWPSIGVAAPDRVALLVAPFYGNGSPTWRAAVSWPDFVDLRAASPAWPSMAASTIVHQPIVAEQFGEVVAGEAVSAEYFSTLRLEPVLGRVIVPADAAPDAAAVVVLGHRFWRQRFAADAAVVGRTIRIGGRPFEIAGVMSDAYDGLSGSLLPSHYWIPLEATATLASGPATWRAERDRRQLTVVVRLPDGRSIDDVAAELGRMGQGLDASFPQLGLAVSGGIRAPVRRQWTARTLERVHDETFEIGSRFGWLIVGLVGMVLGVACTNLANLTLARGTSRRHEVAIRRAIGASRGRLVREQLVESGLVIAAGAAAGLAVARVLMVWFSTDVPVAQATVTSLEPRMTPASVVAAAIAAALSWLICGLWPAMHLTREAAGIAVLNGGDLQTAPRWRAQRSLIGWQVAVSSAFFLVAALIGRAVLAEARHDSGIAIERLALGHLNFDLVRFSSARAADAIDAIVSAARPAGIESVAITTGMPFGLVGTPLVALGTADRPIASDREAPYAPLIAGTPGTLETLGVPIVAGRGFDGRDIEGGRRVIVLSEAIARTLFGTADAVGREVDVRQHARFGPPRDVVRRSVIGIARDTDAERLFSRRTGAVYVPLAQHHRAQVYLIARGDDPAALAASLGVIARRADSDLAVSAAAPGPMLLAPVYVLGRIVGMAAVGLGGLVLGLAMVGLYGVLSQVVARRRREVGVRMALGASDAGIRRMIMREGLKPVLDGLALGLVAGVLGRLVVRAALERSVPVIDVAAFAVVPVPLVVAALIASYLPARRASRVSPNDVLRT